jgi:hypothetical protein
MVLFALCATAAVLTLGGSTILRAFERVAREDAAGSTSRPAAEAGQRPAGGGPGEA